MDCWEVSMYLSEVTHWAKSLGGIYFMIIGVFIFWKDWRVGIGCAAAAGLLMLGA